MQQNYVYSICMWSSSSNLNNFGCPRVANYSTRVFYYTQSSKLLNKGIFYAFQQNNEKYADRRFNDFITGKKIMNEL